jgi:hypothetical protein
MDNTRTITDAKQQKIKIKKDVITSKEKYLTAYTTSSLRMNQRVSKHVRDNRN